MYATPTADQQRATQTIAVPIPERTTSIASPIQPGSSPNPSAGGDSGARSASSATASAPERPDSPFARIHKAVEDHIILQQTPPQFPALIQADTRDLADSAEDGPAPVLNTRDDGANVPMAPLFEDDEGSLEDSYNSSDEESSEAARPPPAPTERLSIYEVQNRISMNLQKMKIDPDFLLVSQEDEKPQPVVLPSLPSSARSTIEDLAPRDRLASMATIAAAPLPSPLAAAAPQPTTTPVPEKSGGTAAPSQNFAPPSLNSPVFDPRMTTTRPLETPALPPRPGTPEPVSRRTKKAREIVQTELYYLDCLSTMLVHYMVPLRLAVTEKSLGFDMSEEDIKNIFSTALTKIVDIHSSLIQSLHIRFEKWSDTETKIADVILEASSKFSQIYIEYCANYDVAVSAYDKLCMIPSFTQLMLQYKLNSGKALGLSHLLIMPVQRVPRYRLLLDVRLLLVPSWPSLTSAVVSGTVARYA